MINPRICCRNLVSHLNVSCRVTATFSNVKQPGREGPGLHILLGAWGVGVPRYNDTNIRGQSTRTIVAPPSVITRAKVWFQPIIFWTFSDKEKDLPMTRCSSRTEEDCIRPIWRQELSHRPSTTFPRFHHTRWGRRSNRTEAACMTAEKMPIGVQGWLRFLPLFKLVWRRLPGAFLPQTSTFPPQPLSARYSVWSQGANLFLASSRPTEKEFSNLHTDRRLRWRKHLQWTLPRFSWETAWWEEFFRRRIRTCMPWCRCRWSWRLELRTWNNIWTKIKVFDHQTNSPRRPKLSQETLFEGDCCSSLLFGKVTFSVSWCIWNLTKRDLQICSAWWGVTA